MNCCTNCFESIYLFNIIISNKQKGICQYCLSKNVFVYEVSLLGDFFTGIISLYTIDNEFGKPLAEQITLDFPQKVFSQKLIENNNCKQLLFDIFKNRITIYQYIFNNNVRLKFNTSEVKLENNSKLSLSWEKFSNEIKTVNRFHIVNTLDLEKLETLFKAFAKDYRKGEKFYRARINETTNKYKKSEMGRPPIDLAKSGRANPNGISYLYIATDVITTIYEVRAIKLDNVTVGTFLLNDDIKVINLSRSSFDVLYSSEQDILEDVMLNISFIDNLEDELSKPRRRFDSELDYLPTQYISEFVKSIGFDGIEYKSSIAKGGFNIAIFNPEKFKCIKTKNYHINEINYSFEDV